GRGAHPAPRPDTLVIARAAGLLLLALLLAGVGAPVARAALARARERPLPWRSDGTLLFVVDLSTAPGDDARPRVDLALRIPSDQLRYLSRRDSLFATVRLTVEFRTRFGKAEHADTRTIALTTTAH